MGWNYDPNQLSSSELMQVRMEIQDTDSENQKLQDEEITYLISQERNFWSAAARCCELIARSFLAKADVKLGRTMTITYTKMAENYLKMAVKLRQKGLGTVTPWIGGMSVADKETIAGNTDLVAPMFTKTMMENPWVGGYTTDSQDPVGGGNDNPNVDFD